MHIVTWKQLANSALVPPVFDQTGLLAVALCFQDSGNTNFMLHLLSGRKDGA